MKIIGAACIALLAVGCGGDGKPEEKEPVDPSKFDGWVLARWNGSAELAGKVYLELRNDKSFVLYQNIDLLGFTKWTGTYTVSGNDTGSVLSGTYSDDTPWESSYVVELRSETELRLRSQPEGFVSIYEGVVIPGYVKDGVTGKSVRSAAEKPFL